MLSVRCEAPRKRVLNSKSFAFDARQAALLRLLKLAFGKRNFGTWVKTGFLELFFSIFGQLGCRSRFGFFRHKFACKFVSGRRSESPSYSTIFGYLLPVLGGFYDLGSRITTERLSRPLNDPLSFLYISFARLMAILPGSPQKGSLNNRAIGSSIFLSP